MPDIQPRYIDTHWVGEITAGSHEALSQLVGLLEKQVAELAGLIGSLAQGVVPPGLAEQLHLMKGSTASLGLQRIPDELALAERLLRQDMNLCVGQCESVLGMLHEGIDELKSLL